MKNKIIISTRPLSENDSIKKELIARGAIVLDFPMIEISTVSLNERIKETLLAITTFQWMFFTSQNGVKYFFDFLKQLDLELSIISSIKIAVVGKKTAMEVRKNGFEPFLISSGNTSHELLNEVKGLISQTENIILVLGELAGTDLEVGLSSSANVERINVYQTKAASNCSTEIIDKIKSDSYDLIIFTSPSGVRNFSKLMKEQNCNQLFRTACIGTTTEKEAFVCKMQPIIVSSKSDGPQFAQEIENYLNKNNQ